MKKFIAEPLFHFLLIGAALFVGFSVFQNRDEASDNKIVITENDTTVLAANFARTWQRQPTAEELQGLVEGRIRDEIA